MSTPRIALLGLGGTIASTTAPDVATVTPRLDAVEIARSAGELNGRIDVGARSIRQMPSASFAFSDLFELAREIEREFEAGASGVVVTQGTDNIEETAFVLDLLMGDERPVVVTGAMRHPNLAGAEGPGNVRAALLVAAAPAARGLGTLVVMNDEIHAARFVRKLHASSLSAFGSPQCGPLGTVVEEVVHVFTRVRPVHLGGPFTEVPPVALLRCALGDDGRMVGAIASLGYRGLVVEGMGGGHVPATMVEGLADLAGVMPVVVTSRTGAGVALERTYGFAGSESDLLARGLVSGGALDGLKARVALALALAASSSVDDALAQFAGVVAEVG